VLAIRASQALPVGPKRRHSRRAAEPGPGPSAHGTSIQAECVFMVPGRGPGHGFVQRLALLNMPQDLRDQKWVFDAGPVVEVRCEHAVETHEIPRHLGSPQMR